MVKNKDDNGPLVLSEVPPYPVPPKQVPKPVTDAPARPSGPEGETCGSCDYYTRVHYHNKIWRKCHLIRKRWTHGRGTDIRKKDPACYNWKKRVGEIRTLYA